MGSELKAGLEHPDFWPASDKEYCRLLNLTLLTDKKHSYGKIQ